MRKSLVVSMALLFSCSGAYATTPVLRVAPMPQQEILAQRMAGLAPSLRDWVVEEGKRRAVSDPDVGAIGEAVRARLSGQDYTAMDVDALVQLVMRECYRQTDAELRAAAEEVKALNAKKKAEREAAQAAAQGQQLQKTMGRNSIEHRSQLPPPATVPPGPPPGLQARPAAAPLQPDLDAVKEEKDSTSELGEQQQLRMQMLQDRRAKVFETLSNLIRKNSDTAGSITANLK